MTITKTELSQSLTDSVDLGKRDALAFVDSIFEIITDALVEGDLVKISGVGNFIVREKAERPGRNPRTGVDVAVPARRVVRFKPGQKLKARVEAGHTVHPNPE